MRAWLDLTISVLFVLLANTCMRASASEATGSGIKVVASIKPLALLVAPLLDEDDQLSILLPPTSSPHHFSLQVSHMTQLSEADLVLWIGPELERFLTKVLAGMPAKEKLAVSEPYERAAQGTKVAGGLKSGAQEHSQDPHVWLSPVLAGEISERVARALAQIRPERRSFYQQQLRLQKQRLQAFHKDMLEVFKPLQGLGFIAYHPAYTELVRTYKLNQLGYVTLSPEIPPGARHLYLLQQQIRAQQQGSQGKAMCLFVEAGHASAKPREIARQLGLSLAVLDPLGQAPETQSYETLMRRLAQAMSGCLLGGSSGRKQVIEVSN